MNETKQPRPQLVRTKNPYPTDSAINLASKELDASDDLPYLASNKKVPLLSNDDAVALALRQSEMEGKELTPATVKFLKEYDEKAIKGTPYDPEHGKNSGGKRSSKKSKKSMSKKSKKSKSKNSKKSKKSKRKTSRK